MNIRKLILAVDFDGTIVENNWPNIGNEIPGAISTLQRLHKRGHKIIIWTCRAGKPLDECMKWLLAHRVPFDAINKNVTERIKQYGDDTRKVSADLYIDDKAIGMRKMKPSELWEYVRKEVNRMSLEV